MGVGTSCSPSKGTLSEYYPCGHEVAFPVDQEMEAGVCVVESDAKGLSSSARS